MKTPGPPQGFEWKGVASAESRNSLMNLRVEPGFESKAAPAGKTIASTIGSLRGLSLLIRSGGSRCSILDIAISKRVSGLSEPYIDMASI